MQEMQNELSKLRRLRDTDQKSVRNLKEQRDRVQREYEREISDLDQEVDKIQKSVDTWINLIQILEESRAS